MILVTGGIKGGSGKTTLATNLAVMRARKGHEVLLVDADDQQSSAEFTELRSEEMDDPGYTCIRLDGKAVRDQVQRLQSKYDEVIIDTGGRDTTSQRAALTVADVLIVPFGPRSLDIWTLERVEALVADARAINPDLRAYSFINRADHQGSYNDETREVLTDSEQVEFISPTLGDRKAFAVAFDYGQSVVEYTPRDKKARNEMKRLHDAVFETVPK
ncbi:MULTISPECIES: AAA family ATPase [Salinibacter]|jgi:chromosome partitioning protein|uniref:Chromosome partitioning protein n=1 Tax=Salinibacter ruber TaxID=146919 RepID=A0A9X2ZPM5_9BACT|nr:MULTISPECIES: AAA family ATPase [Salinibacter]MCS3669278.1 chromosome partitioning protein [Salinibacter ruber]MCS3708126.1 chromosome partitioning protein [Salinibacter ruber]MCS3854702.1 chromosome partitioning protein [Salinibacter ruber]MCS3860186.1 chromosome partitioning protein [Salinibacter ruber]MCS3867026.1 chromosome partitioning protein [Salinibacter ruber]